MKLFSTSLITVALAAVAKAATCSSNLLIDDYSKYSSNTNSLGQYTSGMYMGKKTA